MTRFSLIKSRNIQHTKIEPEPQVKWWKLTTCWLHLSTVVYRMRKSPEKRQKWSSHRRSANADVWQKSMVESCCNVTIVSPSTGSKRRYRSWPRKICGRVLYTVNKTVEKVLYAHDSARCRGVGEPLIIDSKGKIRMRPNNIQLSNRSQATIRGWSVLI